MRVDRCNNIGDFRSMARRRLPGPIFHYIDGAADDEVTYGLPVRRPAEPRQLEVQMSDGEPGGMTDPPPVVRLEACLLAETAHAFLELLSDIAVGVRGVQDEHGCGLDQVHVGRWFPGSMM